MANVMAATVAQRVAVDNAFLEISCLLIVFSFYRSVYFELMTVIAACLATVTIKKRR
jgi:hypothetical protein